MKKVFPAVIFCQALLVGLAVAQVATPYMGQDLRSIKALSQGEIDGYLKGHGMGMAKAGELNHYPGPKHVLELADSLGISEEQRSKTENNYKTMKARTTALGAEYVEKERILDEGFARGKMTYAQLQGLIEEIAAIQGKIRLAHLEAHLTQRDILTAQQVARYDALRGYHSKEALHHHMGH